MLGVSGVGIVSSKMSQALNAGIARLPISTLRSLEQTVQVSLGKGWFAGVEQEVATALQFLSREARRRPVVADIGANTGDWCAQVLKVAPEARVISFEPGKEAFLHLDERFRADDRVTVVNAAASSTSGDVTLWSNGPGSELASLSKRQLDHYGIDFSYSETVAAVTLDEWFADSPLQPNLLKIDVEGHELDVLGGSLNLLSTVQVVQFEFGGTDIDSRTFLKDFYFLFDEAGFDILRLSQRGVVPVEKYAEQDESFAYANYLAVRRGLVR